MLFVDNNYSDAFKRDLFEDTINQIEPFDIPLEPRIRARKASILNKRAKNLVDGKQDIERISMKVRIETPTGSMSIEGIGEPFDVVID